jgi:ribosomal protein S14
MGEIVDITSNQPHWSGAAVCVGCGHEWIATTPITPNIDIFRCPSCGLNKGIYRGLYIPNTEEIVLWCICENGFFSVLQDHVQCIRCGRGHFYADILSPPDKSGA